jgi:PAS domain-containing protein
VLALIVGIAVLSGFAIMARQLEAAARQGLLESLKSQIQLFRITIDHRSNNATTIATRPYVAEQLALILADVTDPSAFAILRAEAESVLSLGFSALAFYGLHGEPGGAAGSPVEQPALSLPIAGAQRKVLMWDDGFVLYARMTVAHRGKPVGVMVAEQRLSALTDALRAADDFASTAEIAVCKRVAAELECVRQSPPPEVFRVPYTRSLPAARALEGSIGVVVRRDDRRHLVMAAYGPIGNTDLAMTLKLDTEELYAPLRTQLYFAFALMAAMIALGAWLLRRQIAPLVRQIEQSEERLALALDGARLALWDLDARTGKVWLDSQWAQMLEAGSSPTQTTSQELLGLVHPDDVAPLGSISRRCCRARPPTTTSSTASANPRAEWLWIHSRGKVIERDAAGTGGAACRNQHRHRPAQAARASARAPGGARRAYRPAEPQPVPRPHRAGDRAQPPPPRADGGDVSRHRQVQGHQRHLRARCRRRADSRIRAAAGRVHPQHRHCGSPGRRRVRGDPGRARRHRGRQARRRKDRRRDARGIHARRAQARGFDERRRFVLPRDR